MAGEPVYQIGETSVMPTYGIEATVTDVVLEEASYWRVYFTLDWDPALLPPDPGGGHKLSYCLGWRDGGVDEDGNCSYSLTRFLSKPYATNTVYFPPSEDVSDRDIYLLLAVPTNYSGFGSEREPYYAAHQILAGPPALPTPDLRVYKHAGRVRFS